jgi:hypothetical protein
METSIPPLPAIDLSKNLYFQLVYTLTDLLPPPLDDTPEGLQARNHTAIAKVAALLPVNANEADLAAQCIAARAQAEEMLRLLRQHADDIGLVMRLNAQYGSMVRTSLSVHARLMRVQALRQKREAIEGSANQDAWALHVAERSMLQVVDPDATPQQAASPQAATAEVPQATPAANADASGKKNIPADGTIPHAVAFETLSGAQLLSLARGRPDASRLHEAVRDATGESHLARPELPTNGRETPGRGDQAMIFCS